jgi:hypothetical protein
MDHLLELMAILLLENLQQTDYSFRDVSIAVR